MPAVRVERPHQAVASQLRESILSGVYRPGERLPIERELSEHFEVSRSVVRQALLLLEHQGLVRVRSGVGGGPFVTDNALRPAIAAFENVLAVDPDSVADFARAKLVLEPAVVAMAAETITDADIAALEANIEQARLKLEKGLPARDTLLDFHIILVRSTGNRYLAMVVEMMGAALDRLPDSPGGRETDMSRVLADHEKMLAALRRRDADAVRQLTVDHLMAIWNEHLTGDSA